MKKRYIGFLIEILFLLGALGCLFFQNTEWSNVKSLFTSADSFFGEQRQEGEIAVTMGEETEAEPEIQVTATPEPTSTPTPIPTPTIDPESPEGRAMALGLPAPPEIDINSWEYVLVNSENKIDENFAPEIGYASCISTSTEQDARIVDALNKFAADTEAQGLEVYLSSGYRSYWDQSYLFELKCEEYDYETAATIVAIPGTSEHQTGLCCDITDIYRSPKNSSLENTDTYIWMSAHCAEYGFIVRYPKDKEDITKIIYEPWHFRYVGEKAASYIMENGLTLEEFVALYK